MARHQEAGRRTRSKSINHQRNLSATWDRNSPSPPPPTITQEEKVNPKDKGLHAVAHSKVVTNRRKRSMSRKVMTQVETQGVAQSPSCRQMKVNLKEYYTEQECPGIQQEPQYTPPPSDGARAPVRETPTRSWRTNDGSGQASSGQGSQKTVKQGSHRFRSPLDRVAKDRETMARMANPYPEASEVDTLVPAAVQHVRRAGYPSNKEVRKSLDINEKPNRKKN